MPEFFDCMRCGQTSPIVSKPPKCPKCGSGAGVIVTRAARPEDAAIEPGGAAKKDEPRD